MQDRAYWRKFNALANVGRSLIIYERDRVALDCMLTGIAPIIRVGRDIFNKDGTLNFETFASSIVSMAFEVFLMKRAIQAKTNTL